MFLITYLGISSVTISVSGGGATIRWKASKVGFDSLKIFKADYKHPKENPLHLGTFGPEDTIFVDSNVNTTTSYILRTFLGSDSSDTDWLKVGMSVEFAPPSKASKGSIQNLQASKEKEKKWINTVFDTKKLNILIALLIFTGIFFYLLHEAQRNPNVFIRRIAGLDVIDDAVGRSAEMGKPIMFTTGIGSIDSLAILAGITVLKQVAKRAALYEVPVLVPNNDPLVLAASREAVKEAYLEMGRPDLYRENDIFFLTTSQFGFASGMSGMMNRIKPGAVFFMGYFYAESLILAENAYVSGAISVAGTVSIDQLPFFIAACDYTIIGDELYAASAYISRNPLEVAGVKAGDIFKALSVAFIIVGVILATLSQFDPKAKEWFEIYQSLFDIGR
ncbi:MAG: hypothetical protein GXO39_02425 [Thermotogae bacterium]|nr:hypothetical protein [Thermotogota bacterium]